MSLFGTTFKLECPEKEIRSQIHKRYFINRIPSFEAVCQHDGYYFLYLDLYGFFIQKIDKNFNQFKWGFLCYITLFDVPYKMSSKTQFIPVHVHRMILEIRAILTKNISCFKITHLSL